MFTYSKPQRWVLKTLSAVIIGGLLGTAPVPASAAICGSSSTDDGVTTVTFTTSCTWTPPAGLTQVDVVVVGGGGGGGASLNDPSGGGTILAGGGGGGGVVTERSDFAVSGPVTVVVGAGGRGTTALQSFVQSSQPGETSSFGAVIAAGGYSPALINSNNGQKGNGGSSGSNSGGLGAEYVAMGTVVISIGGGGAGAGGAGKAAELPGITPDGRGGNGGAGFKPTVGMFSENTDVYGGGGGGGVNFGTDGGNGVNGGGDGAWYEQGTASPATAGESNTGGGGGGGGVKSIRSDNRVALDGADGGSGVVIIKYVVPATSPSAPTELIATAGHGKASITFTAGEDGGAEVSNYEYSLDGTTWTALSPADTSSPVVISGLTNGTEYTVSLRAVNSVGSGTASSTVYVTPGPQVPDAPTALSASGDVGKATISFTAGSDNGAEISNFEYSLDGATWTALSPVDVVSPVEVPGLTNGTAYSIQLRAVNSVGSGDASDPVSVTPATSPAAPSGLSAVADDESAVITFTAGFNNGAAVTNYEYSLDGTTWIALSPADSTSPVTVTGLTNGTQYAIQLRAVNRVGTGDASGSVSVTPVTVPEAPTSLSATPGNGKAIVSFTAGGDGGSTIDNYKYSYSSDDGSSWSNWVAANVTTSPITIIGLTNSTTYKIKILATNQSGTGTGTASSPVTVTPMPEVPDAPADLSAEYGNEEATISFTAGANNGAAITNYEYSLDGTNWLALSPSDGTSPVTVTGLTNGTSYEITLRGVNSAGSGAVSDAVSVIPATVPDAPTDVSVEFGNAQATLSFTAGLDNGDAISNFEYSLDGATWIPFSPAVTLSPATITGLENGTEYTINLRGVNKAGAGAGSDGISVIPAAVPDAPSDVSVTSGNAEATVVFTPGADNGGDITNYEYSLDGTNWVAFSPSVTTSPVTITGLTNGTTYPITLRAVNKAGSGTSSESASVIPATVPDAPTRLKAVPGNTEITISFVAGPDNGAAITNYEYTLDGGATWTPLSPEDTSSPVTIGQLVNDTKYSVQLRAVNSVGSGVASVGVSAKPLSPLLPISLGSNPYLPAGGVPLGASVLLVNGKPQSVNVKPNSASNATGLDVVGSGFTMSLEGRGSNGKPLGVTSEGALILEQDRMAAVQGSGFKPNSLVKLYVFSTPRYIGSVRTNAKGVFKGLVPIPMDLTVGHHTLQANGFTKSDRVRSLSVGVLLSGKSAKLAQTTVYFTPDSAILGPQSKARLRYFARAYKSRATKVTITGHIQLSPTNANNKALSLRRANVVSAYLRTLGLKVTCIVRSTVAPHGSTSNARNAVVQVIYVK